MSIYDNETKIYPDLNPTAPEEPQTYRLKRLSEIKAFLLMKLMPWANCQKKMNQFNMITGFVDTGPNTSPVITEGISIAAFASGVGLPVGITLRGTNLLFSLATVITRKSFKIFIVKQKKRDTIKLLAQSQLDSIANIISRQCKTETSPLMNLTKYCRR